MEEGEQFINFHTKLQDIVNAMRGLGEKITDSKIVKKILRSLPKRFYPKITTSEECHDLDKIKLEELIGSIQTFELKFKPSTKNKGIALKAEETPDPDVESDGEMGLITQKFKRFMKKKYKKEF